MSRTFRLGRLWTLLALVLIPVAGAGCGSSKGSAAPRSGTAALQVSGALSGRLGSTKVHCTLRSTFVDVTITGAVAGHSVSLTASGRSAGSFVYPPSGTSAAPAVVVFGSSARERWVAGFGSNGVGRFTVDAVTKRGTADLELSSGSEKPLHLSGSWSCP